MHHPVFAVNAFTDCMAKESDDESIVRCFPPVDRTIMSDPRPPQIPHIVKQTKSTSPSTPVPDDGTATESDPELEQVIRNMTRTQTQTQEEGSATESESDEDLHGPVSYLYHANGLR